MKAHSVLTIALSDQYWETGSESLRSLSKLPASKWGGLLLYFPAPGRIKASG